MDEKLRNLGPASLAMLRSAGIASETDLRALGAVQAFIAVKRAGCRPGLNLLWALEGALSDRAWQVVAREDRLSLLLQLEDAERAG